MMWLNPLNGVHSFSAWLVKTFGYHMAVHIEDALTNTVAFLLGMIVLSLLLTRAAMRVDMSPNNGTSKSQMIVVRESGYQVIYRKKPNSYKEAFWQIVAMAWVATHPRFRGTYYYRKSKFMTISLWSAALFGLIYLLVITFFNVDVIPSP